MKHLLALAITLGLSTAAQAQQTAPQYCNAAAIYDTQLNGTTQLVVAQPTGAIYVCGFIISPDPGITAAVSVALNYSTGVGGVAVQVTPGIPAASVGALTPHLTPLFTFNTNALGQVGNIPGAWPGGGFVPQGNGLNLTTTATQTIHAIIYYFQQTRG